MEHRWGVRIAIDIPVQLRAVGFLCAREGRLKNLSASGAWISVDFEIRRLSQIDVILETPCPAKRALSAYIVRKGRGGIGVEWCSMAPYEVVQILKAAAGGHADSGPFSSEISEHGLPGGQAGIAPVPKAAHG